ncbi:hypothetical protein AV530_005829 [Patagioenas fasciata monilis]|uniref:Uncharacterized protein n=1 Tax=Patagioenas fasciata monilis TaxID=372326 RepID=A0A1V4JMS7_PATFA|nr:hypothetical protein AV530_005829 [Patagioenas fasciata monilis]
MIYPGINGGLERPEQSGVTIRCLGVSDAACGGNELERRGARRLPPKGGTHMWSSDMKKPSRSSCTR